MFLIWFAQVMIYETTDATCLKGKTNVKRCIRLKQQSVYRIEQSNTEVLDDAVKSHEFEHTERSYKSGSTLPVERQTQLELQSYKSH